MKKIKFLISALAILGLLSTVSMASDDEREEEKDPSCCCTRVYTKIASTVENYRYEIYGASMGYSLFYAGSAAFWWTNIPPAAITFLRITTGLSGAFGGGFAAHHLTRAKRD